MLRIMLQKRVRLAGHGMRVTLEAFNLFNIPQRRFTDNSTLSVEHSS